VLKKKDDDLICERRRSGEDGFLLRLHKTNRKREGRNLAHPPFRGARVLSYEGKKETDRLILQGLDCKRSTAPCPAERKEKIASLSNTIRCRKVAGNRQTERDNCTGRGEDRRRRKGNLPQERYAAADVLRVRALVNSRGGGKKQGSTCA